MQVKAVAERDVFARREFEVAGFLVRELLEIMAAKRIGGEQTVVANVPPGGMTRILRMIENSDADGFPVYGAVIIAPIGALAPGIGILDAFAVDNVTLGALLLPFEAHRF